MSMKYLFTVSLLVLVATMGTDALADGRTEHHRLFVVISPRDAGPSFVQAMDIGYDGRPVAAESYSALGNGAYWQGPQGVVVAGEFLYVSNNMDGTITGFRILSDGKLETLGSYYASSSVVTNLAAHPEIPVLYASMEFAVGVLRIEPSGALAAWSTVPLGAPRDLEVNPSGETLYVASMFGPEQGMVGYPLDADGAPGAPFHAAAGGRPNDVEVASDGSRAYLLTLDDGLVTFHAGPEAELLRLDRLVVGEFTRPLELTADDRFGYVGETNRQHVHGVEFDDGGLPAILSESPFAAQYGVCELIAPRRSPWLYQVTRETREVRTFTIAEDGSLEPVGITPVPGELSPNGAAFWSVCHLDVVVDVRPGSDVNPLPRSPIGLIPVAVLGSENVDVTTIDSLTLRFGPDGAAPVHGPRHGPGRGGHVGDLNLDGFPDLLVHFRVQDAGIGCEDVEVSLVGETTDGCAVRGSATVLPGGSCTFFGPRSTGSTRPVTRRDESQR